MRKPALITLGTVSAAVLAFGGIASASTAHQSSSDATRLSASAATSSSRISAEQAKAIALAHVHGGRVTEINMDLDNGRQVWNVHLATAAGIVEVKVDVLTGAARLDDDNARNEDGAPARDHTQVDDRSRGGHGADDTQSDDCDHSSGGHGTDDGSGHH